MTSSGAGSPDDSLKRRMEHHAVAWSLLPWERKEHDDLEPEGETAFEVIDNWMACRAAIFDVGLGQHRYALTDLEVQHLAEHVQKWIEMRDQSVTNQDKA